MNDSTPPILILDDSPVLARHLQSQLRALGLDARIHADSAAVPVPEAGLIFVELLQASGNGFQRLRALAREHACPLVLLSGTGRSSDRHWGLQAGAAAVLRRPVATAALRRCLQELDLLGPTASGTTSRAQA